MPIKRNPLGDNKKPIEKTMDGLSAGRDTGVDAFISQATAQPTERINPWEESGPEIIKQQFFQVPLGSNRKLEIFWRISRENTSK